MITGILAASSLTANIETLRGYFNLALDIGILVMVYRIGSHLVRVGVGALVDYFDQDEDQDADKADKADKFVYDEEGWGESRRTYYGDSMDDGRIRLRGFGESNDDDY